MIERPPETPAAQTSRGKNPSLGGRLSGPLQDQHDQIPPGKCALRALRFTDFLSSEVLSMGWRQSAFNEIPICARGGNTRQVLRQKPIRKSDLALLIRKVLKGLAHQEDMLLQFQDTLTQTSCTHVMALREDPFSAASDPNRVSRSRLFVLSGLTMHVSPVRLLKACPCEVAAAGVLA